jgi:hypothetical protein
VATESPYATKLKDAIDRSGKSVRQVARLLADRTGNSLDDERSAVYRYLKTQEPMPQRAEHLAAVLSAPELAEVSPRAGRRSSRLAELEAEVERLHEQQLTFAEEVIARLAALEADQAPAVPQSDRRETGDRGAR